MGNMIKHSKTHTPKRSYIKEKVKRFKKEAEQGDAKAQNILGNLYYYGLSGVKKDIKEAIKWYIKAGEQGYIRAQLNLGRYYFSGKVEINFEEACKWYKKAADQGSVEGQKNLLIMQYLRKEMKKRKLE